MSLLGYYILLEAIENSVIVMCKYRGKKNQLGGIEVFLWSGSNSPKGVYVSYLKLVAGQGWRYRVVVDKMTLGSSRMGSNPSLTSCELMGLGQVT